MLTRAAICLWHARAFASPAIQSTSSPRAVSRRSRMLERKGCSTWAQLDFGVCDGEGWTLGSVDGRPPDLHLIILFISSHRWTQL